LRKDCQVLKTESYDIEGRLSKIDNPIGLYEKILEEKKKSREELSEYSASIGKQAVDSKFEDLVKVAQKSGAEMIDKLSEEQQNAISKI
jgi:hypothetical protein